MIVTVDVWDTLLRRVCHPDAVKDAVSRYLILRYEYHIPERMRNVERLTTLRLSCEAELGIESRQRGLDDEYSIEQVYRRWLTRISGFNELIFSDIIIDLLDMEVAHEINVTYKDPDIENSLRAYDIDSAIAVSDFYMPWKQLQLILAAHGLTNFIKSGYVSCEVGLNKRSGRLFGAIAELHRSHGEWVHLGDNKDSDVLMANKSGARAFLYEPTRQHALRQFALFRFRDNNKIIYTLESELLHLKCEIHSEMGRAGLDFVLPMAGFLTHIYEVALLNHAKHILFFTREGVFFKSAYDTLYGNVAGLKPQTYLLEVSRIATFCASLRDCSIKEMMRLWNQYSIQSLGSMFKSLNIFADDKLIEILSEHELNLGEVLKYPWRDVRIVALFKDERFLGIMNANIIAARKKLKAYFDGLGLGGLSGNIIVVDIGWRGTIQDNLAYLYPNLKLIGCYWGLNRFLNEQPTNVVKYAYGPDLNKSRDSADLLDTVSPLEMLTNSNTGSVIGYERIGDRTIARCLHDDNEDAVHIKYVAPFQIACIQGLRAIRPLFMGSVLSSGDLHSKFCQWWHAVVRRPLPVICDAFLELNHNETFGVGRFIIKQQSISCFKSFLFPIVPSWSREVNEMMNAVGWRDGFLFSKTACPNLQRAFRINGLVRKVKFQNLYKTKIHTKTKMKDLLIILCFFDWF